MLKKDITLTCKKERNGKKKGKNFSIIFCVHKKKANKLITWVWVSVYWWLRMGWVKYLIIVVSYKHTHAQTLADEEKSVIEYFYARCCFLISLIIFFSSLSSFSLFFTSKLFSYFFRRCSWDNFFLDKREMAQTLFVQKFSFPRVVRVIRYQGYIQGIWKCIESVLRAFLRENYKNLVVRLCIVRLIKDACCIIFNFYLHKCCQIAAIARWKKSFRSQVLLTSLTKV